MRDVFGGCDHEVSGSGGDTVKVGSVQAGREDEQRPWKHEQMCQGYGGNGTTLIFTIRSRRGCGGHHGRRG
jgi:hypothetical protein